MTLVGTPLLLLPVHPNSEAEFESKARRLTSRNVAEVQRVYGKPLSELPPGLRTHCADVGMPPPWLLNNVVGWTVLGLDNDDSLCGDLYCRRKDLARRVRDRITWERDTTANNAWMHCGELARHSTQRFRVNADYTNALTALVAEAKADFRSRWPRWRQSEVLLPPFGLECIDWVEAIGQVKERAGLQRTSKRG